MSKQIEAPLSLYTDLVHPAWLDYNQHMTEGYYSVVFGSVTDAFMDFVGLDAAYREQTKCTIYTVETHVSFQRELKAHSPLRATTQLLDFDAKRLHVFHQMFHAQDAYLAATMEAMLLHVNHEPRAVPLPGPVLTMVAAIHQVHQSLPTPPQVGRAIGMSRREK